ncbi:hypothetical protein [Anaeromyxobacter dehalogenans]|uniref:hypothetical protein n=1 Tax=Anaeromyxobacter dehalogenans TaxID=161493 RepID=UPI00123723AF|nr:hypothetical protein [Anaeromyxobacter dehalogenans]
MTPEESKAVAVLTGRFETVVFTSGRLATETLQPGALGAVDSVRLAAYVGRFWLDELRPDAGRSLAELSRSLLVGAKDFRAPSGPPPSLGGVRSTKCFVFTLRPGARYDLDARLASAARVPGMPDGRTGKARQQEGEPEPVSWFAAPAGTAYVVLANDLDELRAVVRMLSTSGPPGAANLLDAPLLAGQSAWAHRRYRIARAADPGAAGTKDLSPSAIALVVVPDVKSNTVRVRLHGAPGDTAFVAKLNTGSFLPAFREVEPGVWESVAVRGASRDTDAEMLLSVLYLLGFGVFL